MDELAQEWGFEYSATSADIDEKALERRDNPRDLVMALAHAKAAAILERWAESPDQTPSEGLLITADQVVVCDGQILEKPESEEQARQFIRGYSETSAFTVGSVRVTNLAHGAEVAATDTCEVEFKSIPEEVVDQLVAEGTCYSCAGGLMVEHSMVSPYIKAMHGDIDSIMGLPKALLLDLMRKAALPRPAPKEDRSRGGM